MSNRNRIGDSLVATASRHDPSTILLVPFAITEFLEGHLENEIVTTLVTDRGTKLHV